MANEKIFKRTKHTFADNSAQNTSNQYSTYSYLIILIEIQETLMIRSSEVELRISLFQASFQKQSEMLLINKSAEKESKKIQFGNHREELNSQESNRRNKIRKKSIEKQSSKNSMLFSLNPAYTISIDSSTN